MGSTYSEYRGGERFCDGEAAAVDMCAVLPEGCIANVLSLTSPRDVCRMSLVASTFRSASESDAVWERFLPADYKDIIARSVDPDSMPAQFGTKKQLYLWLADNPLIVDHGSKSFSLEKGSGKRSYMLSARDLLIVWGDTPRYWRWISHPDSRFPEACELTSVCWLEIRGRISTSLLSPNTNYAAYMVFKLAPSAYGFEYQPVEASVGIRGGEAVTRTVYLDPESEQRQRYQIIPRRMGRILHLTRNLTGEDRSSLEASLPGPETESRYPKVRGDGWMEIEVGEYFIKGNGDDGELEVEVSEVKAGEWKSGLIVQGIEIRPRVGDSSNK